LEENDLEALGSIRKIMTANHAVWIRAREVDVPKIATTAEFVGYKLAILAHSKGGQ
jgi:hypothetical protein